MIAEEIKDKLKLNGPSLHHANSFIHNCEILWSDLLNCYVADCDLKGEPLEKRFVALDAAFINNTKILNRVEMTEEFVLNASEIVIVAFLKNHFTNN